MILKLYCRTGAGAGTELCYYITINTISWSVYSRLTRREITAAEAAQRVGGFYEFSYCPHNWHPLFFGHVTSLSPQPGAF